MEGGDAARSVAVLAEEVIYAFRIGCFIHVLHLADNVGMESVLHMCSLGSGSFHEWPKHHLACLLGSAWYNMSRSDVSNTIGLISIFAQSLVACTDSTVMASLQRTIVAAPRYVLGAFVSPRFSNSFPRAGEELLAICFQYPLYFLLVFFLSCRACVLFYDVFKKLLFFYGVVLFAQVYDWSDFCLSVCGIP